MAKDNLTVGRPAQKNKRGRPRKSDAACRPPAKRETARAGALRGEALRDAMASLLAVEPDLLHGLRLGLSDLAHVTGQTSSESARDRFAWRLFCVERFRQLRRAESNRRLKGSQLAAIVSREAAAINPAWHCNWHSLRLWTATWNAIAEDGVAAGWRGLMFPMRPDVRGRRSGRGRFATRSPEAVRFFFGLYREATGQTVAACHRKTVAEANRHDWAWPRSADATREWLRRRRKQRSKKG